MSLALESYFSPAVQEIMRSEIEAANGNEVFFVGMTNEAKIVTEVKAMARGNRSAVAAHTEHTEPEVHQWKKDPFP